jgi:hypothetical protein
MLTFPWSTGDCDSIIVDVIISENIPVNDFNVNQLTYSPKEGLKSFGEETELELTNAILTKQARMLKEYPLLTMHRDSATIQWNRIEKLIRTGWEITGQAGQKYHSRLR